MGLGGISTATCRAAPTAPDRASVLRVAEEPGGAVSSAPLPLLAALPPRRAPPAPPPILFQLAAALSKTVVTLILALGASPPPANFLRHGCLPLAMRLSAWDPAGVGPLHWRVRLRARLLPHAPQREQKANGASPATRAMTCPLWLHASAFLWAICPRHLSDFCLAVRASPLAQVPQHSHLQEPWLNDQKCICLTLASSALEGPPRLRRRCGSADGNNASAAPTALATRGARFRKKSSSARCSSVGCGWRPTASPARASATALPRTSLTVSASIPSASALCALTQLTNVPLLAASERAYRSISMPAYILLGPSALQAGALAARTTFAQSDLTCAGRAAIWREMATPRCSPACDVCGNELGTGIYTARILLPSSSTCAAAVPALARPRI